MRIEPILRLSACLKTNCSMFLFALLFGGVVTLYTQTPETRIAATWQVVRYDIEVTLPQTATERSVTSRARLEVRNIAGQPATSLTLRINQNAQVSSVRINDSSVGFTKGEERLGGTSLQRVAIRVPSVPAGSVLSAEVEYSLNITDNSGLSSIGPNGAQFLPMSFWYPTPNSWYFARGADFAPFRIRVSAPAGLSVITAGKEDAGAHENGLHGQPFFVAGRWDVSEHSGVTFHLPKDPGAEAPDRAAELARLALDARSFAATFLGDVPEAPIKIVAVRRGAGFATGGTVLLDESVFRRDRIDSLTTMTVAEAMARLWLGDKINVTDDGNGVIREGLARFIATRFLESKFGDDIAAVERLRQRTAYGAVSRRDGPLNTISPIDDYYFAAVPNKGAMFWRLLERKVGRDEFIKRIRRGLAGSTVRMAELRALFNDHKPFVDFMLDQVTDMNLMAGLPQVSGGEAKVALRNTGPIDVTVDVMATLENGETITAPATIRAQSFGEIIFRTSGKIVKVEIDPEKNYPQSDYSDDVAPQVITESDPLLAVRREFDRQRFVDAETLANTVLREFPRFDDVRVLLARSLLAQNKVTEAEREFRQVLEEQLPTARSVAWANVGLADVMIRTGRSSEALPHTVAAIRADAEYGASLQARNLRNRISSSSGVEESIRTYFTQFDRAAVSNRKAELEALALPGEVNRYVSGISGQATTWTTSVAHVDMFDANTALVEVSLNVRLLTRDPEFGLVVYRLVRSGNSWRLAGVEIFEVR